MSLVEVAKPFGGAEIPTAIAAIKELQGLNINVVAGAASSTKIDLAAIRKEDTLVSVIEFVSGEPTDRTSVTTISETHAVGTFTLNTVIATDAVLVGGKTLTFVASNPNRVKGEVLVGDTDTASAANLAVEINRHLGSLVTATANLGVVTLTAVADGTAGNSITISSPDTTITASGANLSGGTATGGISISTSTAGNSLVVVWFNKR